jgi:cation transport ATPase
VVTVLSLGWMSESDLLRAAAAVACGAGHAGAEALLREADMRALRLVDAVNCELAACGGVAGVVSGSRILVGGQAWLRTHGVALPAVGLSGLPDGALLVASDGRLAGVLVVEDA